MGDMESNAVPCRPQGPSYVHRIGRGIRYMLALFIYPLMALGKISESDTGECGPPAADLWFAIIVSVILPALVVLLFPRDLPIPRRWAYAIAGVVYLLIGTASDWSFRKHWGGPSRRGYL